MKTDLNQDAITKQAANFVARLYSGELSAEEENEIYAWCDPVSYTHLRAHET